jgi:dolichol-phosphate mannosyltransferase
VPITFHNRKHGESKLTVREQLRYLEHLSRLYDYRFPKASPRIKFIIAWMTGAGACGLTVAFLDLGLRVPSFLSVAAGLMAMMAVTLAFFVRYVRAQREYLEMRNPMSEFAGISLAEFIVGWSIAISLNASLSTATAAAVLMVLLTRYTLRKVFLHDLRGGRGMPREAMPVPPVPAPAPTRTAASA